MTFRTLGWKIFFKLLLLFVTWGTASFLVVGHLYVYLIVILPVMVLQGVDLYRFHSKAQTELQQFVESVQYRDFSQHFDLSHAPVELIPLRKRLNQISTVLKLISKEKETQNQYLQ